MLTSPKTRARSSAKWRPFLGRRRPPRCLSGAHLLARCGARETGVRRKLTGCARRLQAKTKLLHFTVDCSKPVRRGDFRGSARLAAPMSFMAADAVCRKSEMSSVQNSWDGNMCSRKQYSLSASPRGLSKADRRRFFLVRPGGGQDHGHRHLREVPC